MKLRLLNYKEISVWRTWRFVFLWIILAFAGNISLAQSDLQLNKSIEKSLKGGETHIFTTQLKHGQTLQISIIEKGVDLKIALYRGEDEKLIGSSDFGYGYDREVLTRKIEKDGNYYVLISSRQKKMSGKYQMTAKLAQSASLNNLEQIKAEKLFAQVFTKTSRETKEITTKLKEALQIWKKLDDKYWEGYTFNLLGAAYFLVGENEKALKYFNQALVLRKAVGDKNGEASTINNIGRIYYLFGNSPKSLEYYSLSISLFKEVGNENKQALVLNNIGGVYDELGENQKALDVYNRALSLYKANKNTSGEAKILSNLGSLYSSLGENQKALNYYNQSLLLMRTIGNKRGEGLILNNIGGVYDDLGEKQKALSFYSKALSIAKSIKDKKSEGIILNNLGRIYETLDSKEKSLNYYNGSLKISRAIGDKHTEVATLNNIGRVYYGVSKHLEALESFNEAFLLTRITRNKTDEAETLSNLMKTWEHLDNTGMAVLYGKLAVNKYQELRDKLKGLDYDSQKSYLKNIQDTYRNLNDLLVKDSRIHQALEVLDVYKNPQFSDLKYLSDLPTRKISFTGPELHFSKQLEQQINNVVSLGWEIERLKLKIENRKADEQESSQLIKLEADYKTAIKKYKDILENAETEFSKKINRKAEIPINSVTEVQNALRELETTTKQKTAAIYTLIAEDRFHLIVVTEDNIKAFSLLVEAKDLEKMILQFYVLLQSPNYDPRLIGKDLYDIIFKPIEAELEKQNIQTLMWQLDGNLQYIPMAALFDGEKYLVERYENVVFTRFDREKLTKAVSPNMSGVGFGSSQSHIVNLPSGGGEINFSALPGVEVELKSIFQTSKNDEGILKGEVFADIEFTKERFYQVLERRYPVIHISSHFRFYPGDSSRSFLLLGDGNPLTLDEMKNQKDLFEGVELLVLSGSDTAAVLPDANGKEIDGFAGLFQRLGASSVIATLWGVSDQSTVIIMRNFYANRQNGKLNKAESLRKAQLELLKGNGEIKSTSSGRSGGDTFRTKNTAVEEKYRIRFMQDEEKPFSHPFYWSPFILIGNWK